MSRTATGLPEPAVLLRVRSLSKTFAGVTALDGVDLDVHAGEVLAVVGQNGSGKSTLVKSLSGAYAPDAGSRIEVADDDGRLDPSPATVRERLHFIHQDLALVGTLSTVENLALGRGADSLRPTRPAAEREHAQRLLADLGMGLDVTAPVSTLSASERTVVAIARALDGWEGQDHVLVLDEPTAALPAREAALLFAAMRRLAARGAGLVFISHHLDEVIGLADRVVALRGGRVVADLPVDEVDHTALVRMIVGQELAAAEPVPRTRGEAVLEVRGLFGDQVEGISLTVHAGETVGITGLLGSGREELAGLVFGAREPHAGQVLVAGTPVRTGRPRAAISAGMAFVPADRPALGGVMTMTAQENLLLPGAARGWRALLPLRGREEAGEAERWADEVDLLPRAVSRQLGLFSGGNQQKFVIAKWLRTHPRVVLLDEPSQGVDVGAAATIYELIARAAARGTAVLVASSDAEELAALCDRVLVLRDGVVAEEIGRADLTEERLLLAAAPEHEPTPRAREGAG